MLARLVVHLFNEHDALESFHDSDRANAFYRKRGWHVTSAYRDEEYGVEMVTL